MTQDEIIEMARKAGMAYDEKPDVYVANIDDLQDFAKLVAAKERKALAQCPDCGKSVGDAGHIHTCSPQPQQEPMAWVLNRELFWPSEYEVISQNGDNAIPLYTTPPQRKPLTDEQREQIYNEWCSKREEVSYDDLMLAIEAAHGIGEKK